MRDEIRHWCSGYMVEGWYLAEGPCPVVANLQTVSVLGPYGAGSRTQGVLGGAS
jgi:hypothetical protein